MGSNKVRKSSNAGKKFAWAVGLVAIGFLIYNFASSFLFDLEFSDINVESLRQRFSEVHFAVGGNDFGGAIFWLDANNLTTPIEIENGTGASYQKKSCSTQVRGIYYNNQRGLRLRPLDATSLTLLKNNGTGYDGLSITGGFYRDCITLSGSASNTYSIYGYITYTLTEGSESLQSYLAAGTKLNHTDNTMDPGLAENFQYFNNTTPLGYFYDSNGGIGFVGGELTGHENLITYLNTSGNSINDAFTISGVTIVSTNPGQRQFTMTGINTAQDTLWKLLVQGTVGLSQSFSPEQRLSLLGNQESRTVILGGTEINSSNIMNLARKNADQLCRGRTIYTSLTSLPPAITPSPICIKNSPNLVINLGNPTLYQGKTIIVENTNITLEGTMLSNYGPFELFINKGNLYIDPITVVLPMTDFNTDGFPTSVGNSINKGMYLKGNFIINGLIIGGVYGTAAEFTHKLHIQGKVVSLNTPTQPAPGRISQVNALFGTSAYADWINLEKTFTWYCNFDGTAVDGTDCSTGGVVSLVPLIILNGNFSSNLLR